MYTFIITDRQCIVYDKTVLCYVLQQTKTGESKEENKWVRKKCTSKMVKRTKMGRKAAPIKTQRHYDKETKPQGAKNYKGKMLKLWILKKHTAKHTHTRGNGKGWRGGMERESKKTAADINYRTCSYTVLSSTTKGN